MATRAWPWHPNHMDLFWRILPPAVAGTVFLLAAVVGGWWMGRHASLPPTRLMWCWLTRVILPLVGARSWWQRTVTIFTNNTLIAAITLAAGRWETVVWIVIVGLGLNLGIALRIMSTSPTVADFWQPPQAPGDRRRARVGVALNLVEPPAIMLTLGLSLGQGAVPAAVSASEAWAVFTAVSVPLLLIAAAGEATWLGTGVRGKTGWIDE